MQEPAYFRQMEGLYQACFISFEYQLHLVPGTLVVADRKDVSRKILLKQWKVGCWAKAESLSLSRCVLLTVYFGGKEISLFLISENAGRNAKSW